MKSISEVGPLLAQIARRAVEAQLADESFDAPPLGPAAPVFVTIRTRDGALRGCIGTLTAKEPHVCQETARTARLAALRDPRFPPLSMGELADVRFEVSVLEPEEPVTGVEQLDPAVFGVVVRDASGRRSVLLPNVPGIDTAQQQLDTVRLKGGIHADSAVRLTRFRVAKFE